MAGNADGAGEPPQTRPEAEVPGRYRYFAFISYSRKDSRAAKWLQRRLEWFRFPVKLVAEERRPKAGRYLRPIYRDKTHLEVDPAHYWDNLKHAIDQSRYLIVLCTPDAAASEPVDREVVHFLKSREGTVENLVPVILKGRVGCGGEEECLGRTLRELGSQIQDRNLPSMVPDGEGAEVEGWENGFIGLAAYLLQLQRSALMDHVRREERRQKLRARILAGVMGVLAAGAILGGAMAFRYGIEAAAQRDEVTKQRNQQDELLWRASRADQEAAVTLPIGDRERVALMDRALSYQPRNAGALAASGVYAFGSAALRLNWITPVAHTGFCQAFSPDGRLLAVGDGLEGGPGGSGEGRATVFDAVTGRRLFQLSFKALVTSVGFSEDGGLVIAASVDQSIGVAETATGKERARWQFEDPVLSTLCSPDGRHVAMVNNEKVRVIEVSSGKVVREAAATGISNAKFSPDGRHLVVLKGDFASRPVATLEMATGKWRDVADGPALLSWIAFSPGSERLLLAKGTEIFAADSVGGPWAKWANLAGELDQLSFSPDGRYVAAEVQADLLRASMVVLDATTGKPMAEVDLGERLVAASFSPDGRWFAVAGKERIRVIELPTGKELGRIEPGAEINALLFNADGSGLLVDCRDQSLRMFEISGGKIGAIVPAKRGELFATCSPDGLSLAAGGGGGLVLKNLATGEVIAQAKISGLVMASDFSPDGGFLATGSKDGKACVMDAKSGRLIHELSVSGAVHGVAVSPDSRMIAMGTAGKEVMFFNAATGEKERSLRFETEVEAVCFSTDGRWLAAGGDETATVVNLKEDHEIRVCTFEGRIHSLGLSSDGQTLAAGLKDGTAHVVDLARGITKRVTQGEGWMSVAMTPGSSHVVIGGWDKLVRLIEVKSGTECARMAFGNRVTSVYISHGGRHLTVATDGGDMRIIDGRWLEVAETAIPAWQSALRFQSQSRLNAGGKLVTLSAAELVEAGSEVDAFLKQEMTAARSWQRRVVEWGRTPPLGRTLSPWSTEMMWKAAGQTFMQLNPAQKSAMAQCVDSAPWHPLAPLTVARLEVPAEGEPEASAKAKMPQHKHLALLTLKRLRNADERVYERESLAEYALWTARVIQQELGLEEEALDALELQIRWAPQEKQVELQARLDRLIAALAKENSTKDGSGKQPVAFRFQYAAEPDPGPRVWMRSGDVWEERSPSGAAKRLRVIGRGEADGRAGTIAQEMTNPGFEVFIPDQTDGVTELLFRVNGQGWTKFGAVMEEVR